MRIAIDVRSVTFSPAARPGIQRWNYNFLKQLMEIDSENEYILLCRPGESQFFDDFQDNFVITELKEFGCYTYFDQFYEQLTIGKVLNSMELDLYLSLYFTVPLFVDFPVISLFDDMIPWIIMEKRTDLIPEGQVVGKGMRLFHFWKRKSAQLAAGIITISESSKSDLNKFWNIDKKKVFVNYVDLEDCFRVIDDSEELELFKSKYQLPDRYILYVATIEPRKNSIGLVKAYAQFRKETTEDVGLVMVGPKGMGYEKFEKVVRDSGFPEDIVVINSFIPREDLPRLYSSAEVFCFPSFYEGFGLTPLEAMACGCPVITSDRSSIPEVAGEAAIYVDPFSVDSIKDALIKITVSSQMKQEYSKKGLQRAHSFRKNVKLEAVRKLFFEFSNGVKKDKQKTSIEVNRYKFLPGKELLLFCTAPDVKVVGLVEKLVSEYDAEVSLITQKGRKIELEGFPIFGYLPEGMFSFSNLSFKRLIKIKSISGDTAVLLYNNLDGDGYLKLKFFTLISSKQKKVLGYSVDGKFTEITWRSLFKDISRIVIFPGVYFYIKMKLFWKRLLNR